MLFPVLPTAADELPKAEQLRIPNPASCLLLVSDGSDPEDGTGNSVVKTGEDPNLKKEGVGDEDAATEEEELLLLLDAFVTGVLVVKLLLVEDAMAVLQLLAPRDEELNIFWLVKLFETRVEKGEENEVFEARGPLF